MTKVIPANDYSDEMEVTFRVILWSFWWWSVTKKNRC